MKTLVVDDDPVAQLLIKEILGPYGPCDQCSNGEEGLLAFEFAHEAGQPYDLIILDLMMPVMDGIQTLEALRDKELQMEDLEKPAKIIVLSVKDEMRSVLTCMALGANDFLAKPVSPKALLGVVDSVGLGSSVASV